MIKLKRLIEEHHQERRAQCERAMMAAPDLTEAGRQELLLCAIDCTEGILLCQLPRLNDLSVRQQTDALLDFASNKRDICLRTARDFARRGNPKFHETQALHLTWDGIVNMLGVHLTQEKRGGTG